MSSIADRQRHDSKINRCRDQSCQAKNQQCHPNDREIMQPVAHGEVSQLSLHGLREFDLDQNGLSTTLPGVTTMATVDVRFGSKVDIEAPPSDVRFTPESGHGSPRS